MKERLLGQLARRIAVAIASAVTLAALAGGSFIVATQSAAPEGDDKPTVKAEETEAPETEAPEPQGTESPGVHGGTVERFHGDGTHPCPMPDGVTLDGNWTHGDYVSAWTDHDKKHEAAKSWCGKPMSSVAKKLAQQAGATAKTHGKSGEPHGNSADHKPADAGSAAGDHPEGEAGS